MFSRRRRTPFSRFIPPPPSGPSSGSGTPQSAPGRTFQGGGLPGRRPQVRPFPSPRRGSGPAPPAGRGRGRGRGSRAGTRRDRGPCPGRAEGDSPARSYGAGSPPPPPPLASGLPPRPNQSTARAAASVLPQARWAVNTSATWSPMGRTGLSDVIGSRQDMEVLVRRPPGGRGEGAPEQGADRPPFRAEGDDEIADREKIRAHGDTLRVRWSRNMAPSQRGAPGCRRKPGTRGDAGGSTRRPVERMGGDTPLPHPGDVSGMSPVSGTGSERTQGPSVAGGTPPP